MPGAPFDHVAYEAAQVADLDAVEAVLADDARLWARQLQHVRALTVRADRSPHSADRRFLLMELAGSWRISQLTAARWVDEAGRFDTALPRTLAMLQAGTLLRHQAVALLHRTRHCTIEVARAVEDELLPTAAGLCPADLAKQADRIVLRLESEQSTADSAEQRHAAAAAQRRTFSRAEPDGMALAGAVLTAQQQVAWRTGLDALERRERLADRAAGIDRTAEQRRADLFAALPAMVLAGTALDSATRELAARLTSTDPNSTGPHATGTDTRPGTATGSGAQATDPGCPGRPWTLGPELIAAQVVLNVHVPVSTVLELSRHPGSLDRYGPISAEHVRLLRPTTYRRVLVDGTTGRPLALDDHPTPVDPDPTAARTQLQQMLRPTVITDTDEPGHDPSARLARLIDLRDAHCCGPGCSTTRTHRDHLDPWPTGPTNARNLGRLSARCHAAKHHGWHLQRHPDGSTTWHSPLHRTYPRPSPHPAPPTVDPYTEPPPLRARPTPPPPEPEWTAHTDPHGHTDPDGLAGPDDPTATAADARRTPAEPSWTEPNPDDDPPPF